MTSPRTIVIVGGNARPDALKRLRDSLVGVTVAWIPTRESDPSAARFSPSIQRSETCLVVVLTGLVRHQHARDILGLARRHGKRVLHLFRSPNPGRIRHELGRSEGGVR